MLELAAAFHSWGYNSMIINLGYTTGAHPFSGGRAEADDIDLAVRWAKNKTPAPIVLWGFSAGGSSALLAASDGARVVAVAADSAFANAGLVIRQQAAKVTHLPAAVFALVPTIMSAIASPGPTDLSPTLHQRPITVPVLLIQGTKDKAIPPSNLNTLQRDTGGTAWAVPGADHIKSFQTDQTGYLDHANAFLREVLHPGTGQANLPQQP
jgi:fermentation-respiration switch protein FrsA (DUF1100 family)